MDGLILKFTAVMLSCNIAKLSFKGSCLGLGTGYEVKVQCIQKGDAHKPKFN